MQLNYGQTIAVEALQSWFYDAYSSKIAILEAPAGFGKTFLVKDFIRKLGRFAKPLATAPFNEATYQLKQALGDLQVDCKTTYSAFKFVEMGEGESSEFKQVEPPDFSEVNLVVIDEASTLPPELLQVIEQTEGIKVLCLGDRDQLPFVETASKKFDACVSPVFTKGYPTWTLTEPMRNSSEIFTFSRECARLIHARGSYPTLFNKPTTFLDAYLESSADKFLEEKAKILAYSNKQVDYWNSKVRKAIFKEQADEAFLLQDKIICIKPCFGFTESLIGKDTLPSILSSKVEKVNCFTNTKADIRKIRLREVLDITCYELSIDSDSVDCNSHVIIYVPASWEEYQTKLHGYYQRALYSSAQAKGTNWRQYKQFQQIFATVKHSYSMTVHRSQGSTISEVFVDWKDLDSCQNIDVRKKLKYVGSSRAKDELFILI